MLDAIRAYFIRRSIRKTFGAYVSLSAVDALVKTGREPLWKPTAAEITPFFASVHNYVGIAEQVPLERLPKLMNAWFGVCTGAIQDEGGLLDKYIGDAVVGMFGAPLPLPDHALRACVASLRCQARVDQL